MDNYTETETKFVISDPQPVIERLNAHAARLTDDRCEHNIRFDTPGATLRESEIVLRLRRITTDETTRLIVTVKKPLDTPPSGERTAIRSRQEYEFTIDDEQAYIHAMQALGYQISWRYEKYRKAYHLEGAEIVVDRTPIGHFVEIEGTAATIHEVAQKLDLPLANSSGLSYAEIFDRVVDRFGLNITHMTFNECEGVNIPFHDLREVCTL